MTQNYGAASKEEVMIFLTKILRNQDKLENDIKEIKENQNNLEKGIQELIENIIIIRQFIAGDLNKWIYDVNTKIKETENRLESKLSNMSNDISNVSSCISNISNMIGSVVDPSFIRGYINKTTEIQSYQTGNTSADDQETNIGSPLIHSAPDDNKIGDGLKTKSIIGSNIYTKQEIDVTVLKRMSRYELKSLRTKITTTKHRNKHIEEVKDMCTRNVNIINEVLKYNKF